MKPIWSDSKGVRVTLESPSRREMSLDVDLVYGEPGQRLVQALAGHAGLKEGLAIGLSKHGMKPECWFIFSNIQSSTAEHDCRNVIELIDRFCGFTTVLDPSLCLNLWFRTENGEMYRLSDLEFEAAAGVASSAEASDALDGTAMSAPDGRIVDPVTGLRGEF